MLGAISEGWCRSIALKAWVPVNDYLVASMMNAIRGDEVRTWDVAELILQVGDFIGSCTGERHPVAQRWEHVRTMLDVAGSVHAVSDGGLIQRRVSDEAAETYAGAVLVEDAISDHLRQAWGHAYGRNPDSSLARHYAIKAVEAML